MRLVIFLAKHASEIKILIVFLALQTNFFPKTIAGILVQKEHRTIFQLEISFVRNATNLANPAQEILKANVPHANSFHSIFSQIRQALLV